MELNKRLNIKSFNFGSLVEYYLKNNSLPAISGTLYRFYRLQPIPCKAKKIFLIIFDDFFFNKLQN